MGKEINAKTVGIIGSLILFLAVVIGYGMMWRSAQPAAIDNSAIDLKYQKVDISSLQTDAQSLIADTQNNGSLPVTAPAAGSVGRDNPFVNP